MWEAIERDFTVFMFVFARMAGMFMFNPLLGKRSVPTMVKMGLSLLMALILAPLYSSSDVAGLENLLVFFLAVLKELAVGFAIGFVMNMFISVYVTAGEICDMQLGITMSRIYDPQSNSYVPLVGNLFSIIYVLMFFSSNGHLTLIKITALSFEIVPPGGAVFGKDVAAYVVTLFGNLLVLALKLAMPLVALELLTEAGVGILTRTAPQINVFMVNIQLKLLVGLIMLVLMMPGAASFFDSMTNVMFEKIQSVVKNMASGAA